MPTYLAADGGDHAGLALKLFSTPAGDSEMLNWTQALGGVRLIGIDGIDDWSAGSANARWLESVLKGSRERLILAFNHFPGYSDGQHSRPARNGKLWTPLQQCRDVICPLLGKYKATAMASAYDYEYERIEPTPDKGVTCIIAGAGGAMTLRQSNRASGNNPFAKTSVFREHTPSYVCFEITAEACVMKAYDLQGNVIDQKTFAPRQP